MIRIPLIFASLALAITAQAQTASEHIALGDHDYTAMNAPGALAHYEQAVKSDPSNYEALWKASRSAVDIGSYKPDDAARSGLYSRAEQYARRAVALNPGDAEGHFAVARALGKTALTQSPRGRIKYATEIRTQALDCLRIDPKHAGCLHVMGMWNAEVMRLNSFTRMVAKNFLGGQIFGSASWKEAIRYMESAVAVDPNRVVHRIDLAQMYVDLKQPDKARAQAEAALKLPSTDVNDDTYKAQARQIIGNLKN